LADWDQVIETQVLSASTVDTLIAIAGINLIPELIMTIAVWTPDPRWGEQRMGLTGFRKHVSKLQRQTFS
jgi:hypothetical protein